jgi:hypothetical protein
MKNNILIIGMFFATTNILSSCGSSNDNSSVEETMEETNLSYKCPLCNEVSEPICPDCESLDLIWCNIDGDISSIVCDNCEWLSYPQNNACFSCEKEMRSNEKFWTNRSGKNYKDCSL